MVVKSKRLVSKGEEEKRIVGWVVPDRGSRRREEFRCQAVPFVAAALHRNTQVRTWRQTWGNLFQKIQLMFKCCTHMERSPSPSRSMQRNQYSIAVGCRLSWKRGIEWSFQNWSFHLLTEKEPDELSVGHATLLLGTSPSHCPTEDPLYHPRAQSWKEECYALISSRLTFYHGRYVERDLPGRWTGRGPCRAPRTCSRWHRSARSWRSPSPGEIRISMNPVHLGLEEIH